MIKEALEYIVGMKAPVLNKIGDQTYSDKPLSRVTYNPKASSIKLSTLSSLIDYIRYSPSGELKDHYIIHIVSPTRVLLFSELDCDRERECLVDCQTVVPEFRYGSYYPREHFNIALQSVFADYEETQQDGLLIFISRVEAGTIKSYGDDGISQQATIKSGISEKENKIVPNPARLAPYRTFVEVEQPISEFIFRMSQDKEDSVKCALFEADGGSWKNKAMQNIKDYLEEALEEEIQSGKFIVLA